MEERYLAFLDILGFSELVREVAHNREKYTNLLRILRDAQQLVPAGLQEGDARFRVQHFSDTIILSSAPNTLGLWHLLLSIDSLFFNLLHQGVLIRGGVSKGPLHHDDLIIFGEAVITAYHLETNVAKYPRVVLSRAVFEDATAYAVQESWAKAYYDSRLIRADDGPAFVHVLSEIEAFNRQLRSLTTPEAGDHPLLLIARNIADILILRLHETMDNPPHFGKVKWFVNYWNRTVCAGGAADRWLQPISILGDFDNRPSTRLPFRHI